MVAYELRYSHYVVIAFELCDIWNVSPLLVTKNECHAEVTKTNVKNRQWSLKYKSSEAHDLFKGLSGFTWNPQINKFEAEDVVWVELIKVNEESLYKSFKINKYE